jgi:H/ACA ribonucleoprotein complex subunit 4
MINIVEGETTSPEHGKRPEERSIEEILNRGVINLDKPAGPTSHEIVKWVKDILEIEKTGQGGTLDPNVTGVLPVALGDGTKGLGAMLEGGKEYIGVIRLHRKVEQKKVRHVIEEFTTRIYQTPPLKSAVKRQRRIREVYYTEVLEMKDRDVLLKIGCQAGTYIRTFAVDVGTALGCGANLLQLRRTKSARFFEEDSCTLHDLKDAYMDYKEEGDEQPLRRLIRPFEEMFTHLPRIVVRDSAVDALCHGADLALPGILAVSEGIARGNLVGVFSLKDEAVALATALKSSVELAKERKGIGANIKRVLMEPGTYPKMWKGSGSNG